MLIVSLLIISGLYFLANLSLIIIWLRNPVQNNLIVSPQIETKLISAKFVFFSPPFFKEGSPDSSRRGWFLVCKFLKNIQSWSKPPRQNSISPEFCHPSLKEGGVILDSFNTESEECKIKLSVIIPVRNEAENILFLLQDLEKQTYPKHKFEVIIADDDSTDDTLKIVQAFQKFTYINLIINQLPPKINNTSPKKRAIDSSIKLASGQLITTTDGDCRVGEKWLENIANFQAQTGAYLVSCAVTFEFDSAHPPLSKVHLIFEKTQTIEFASLIGSGACAMFIQKPNMCNGANLTYLKSVFYEVDGFAGNEDLASGDDEFLMHKIAAKYPDKVKFLKDQNTIVETHAHSSWRSFYNQRKRWASKWKHYNNWQTTALAVFVFLANLVVPLAFSFWLFDFISTKNLFFVLALKFSAEFVFLSLVISFLRKKSLIWLIPFVQIIYPLYVVFFGLVAQKQGEYVWKERKLK